MPSQTNKNKWTHVKRTKYSAMLNLSKIHGSDGPTLTLKKQKAALEAFLALAKPQKLKRYVKCADAGDGCNCLRNGVHGFFPGDPCEGQ